MRRAIALPLFAAIAIFTVAPLCLCGSNHGDTETQAPQRAGETIEVTVVNVDVVVTDRNGRRIQGLIKEDFEVFDGGTRRELSHFAEYSEPATSSVRVETPAAAGTGTASMVATPASAQRQRRVVLLFVELVYFPSPLRERFYESIKNLVHQTVASGDAAVVVSWDGDSLKVRQPATNSLEKLDLAIDQLSNESLQYKLSPYDFARAGVADMGGGVSASPGTDAGGRATELGRINDISVFERRVRAYVAAKFSVVTALARALGESSGKKMLIFASRSVPVFGSAADYQRNLNAMGKEVSKLTAVANANGVVVYPLVADVRNEAVDTSMPGGAMMNAPAAGTASESGIVQPQRNASSFAPEVVLFEQMARETGGIVATSVNEAPSLLTEVARDLQSFYSLGFRADGQGARNIVVKTKNPNYLVRSRTSFSVRSDEQRSEDRVLGALLGSGRSAFAIRAEIGAAAKQRGRLPIEVRIPIRALTPVQDRDGYTFTFTVYISGIGAHGLSEPFRETKSFHAPAADLERARNSFFTYETTVATNSESRRIAIGVVDGTSNEMGLTAIDLAPTR